MVTQEQEAMLREQLQQLMQHGINLEGLNREKMLESTRAGAERRVRMNLLLARIAGKEGITIDDAELEDGLARVAESTGRDVVQVRQIYEERGLFEVLRRQLQDEKAMKFVLDHAEIVTAPVPEAEEKK
jgi:FKBP-type peptidyl-prolyl cis-trans isomerase (trigger factor)